MSLDTWLKSSADRCPGCGHHVKTQGHGGDCAPVAPADEWTVFVRALRQAADPSGLVSQTRVRPLIQTIPPKHRGLLYRRARQEGVLELVGKEGSTDYAGGNGDKEQRVYRLRGAA